MNQLQIQVHSLPLLILFEVIVNLFLLFCNNALLNHSNYVIR